MACVALEAHSWRATFAYMPPPLPANRGIYRRFPPWFRARSCRDRTSPALRKCSSSAFLLSDRRSVPAAASSAEKGGKKRVLRRRFPRISSSCNVHSGPESRGTERRPDEWQQQSPSPVEHGFGNHGAFGFQRLCGRHPRDQRPSRAGACPVGNKDFSVNAIDHTYTRR